MAPILMSGYYSPRHMYLASLGWTVTFCIATEAIWQVERVRYAKVAAVLTAGAVAIAYAIQLHGVVGEWNRAAAISHAAVQQIQQEAATQPEGTLVIAGVPRLSWAFAVPHSVRPPFTRTDVTQHISVISDSTDYCCNALLWEQSTRAGLRAWHDHPDHPPVIALYWNATTGRMIRISGRDDPQLATVARVLLETSSREALDSVIRGLLNDYVALR